MYTYIFAIFAKLNIKLAASGISRKNQTGVCRLLPLGISGP